MTKASDNLFPKVIIVEGTAPSSPSSGDQTLFIDSADHKLKRKNSSGTVTTIEGGGSSGSPSLTLSTSNSAGAAGTFVATDATIAAFDATVPVTQAYGDAAATGSAGVAARRDHKHGMPAAGVVMLADSLLGSDTASFDFTSISGSYKHLMVIYSARSDRASSTNDPVKLTLNNDTGSNYDYIAWDFGTGSGFPGALSESFAASNIHLPAVTAASSTAGDVGGGTVWLPDYASTTLNKMLHAEGGVLFARSTQNIRLSQAFGSWRSTSAITRITLAPVNGSNFKTGSRATLYGYS